MTMEIDKAPSTESDPRDVRIAELERELAVLRERLWLQDGCGDSGWDN
jgi:hypothetical protein